MFQPSRYQQSIFEWVQNGTGNAICSAVAGSGKSTTLVQAAKLLNPNETGLFIAFNTHIVKELTDKLRGTTMIAQTIHSTAKRALEKTHGRMEVDDKLLQKLLDQPEYTRWSVLGVRSSLSDVLRMACVNLTNFEDDNALWSITEQYGIELPTTCKIGPGIELTVAKDNARPFFDAVRKLLSDAELMARNAHKIDFTGMIYWPVKWNVAFDKFDWVFLDECQDLSALQREIALRCVGKRALAVGDKRQAIYAFAGASSNSFSEVGTILNAITLPLSVCYRCPTTVLDLARAIVPEIENAPNAPTGKVEYVKSESDILDRLDRPPSMWIDADNITLILSRKTAPLITACIKAIGRGIKAKVRGRDVSKGLTTTVKAIGKLSYFTMDKFGELMHKYENDQIAWLSKREGNEEKIQQLSDQIEAILAIYDRYKPLDIPGLVSAIEPLFADDNDRPEVWFSTVHRAKGLEADNVAILCYSDMPLVWKGQRADQAEQEMNIKYVALTRAKKSLIIHGVDPKAGIKTKDSQGKAVILPTTQPSNEQATQVMAYTMHGQTIKYREGKCPACNADNTVRTIDPPEHGKSWICVKCHTLFDVEYLNMPKPMQDVVAQPAPMPTADIIKAKLNKHTNRIAPAQKTLPLLELVSEPDPYAAYLAEMVTPQQTPVAVAPARETVSVKPTEQTTTATRPVPPPTPAIASSDPLHSDKERQTAYRAACKHAQTLHPTLRFIFLSKARNQIFSNRGDWRNWK